MTDREWITVREAADMMGVSDSTIYNLARAGEVVTMRPTPKALRISVRSLQSFIDGHQRTEAPRATPRRKGPRRVV